MEKEVDHSWTVQVSNFVQQYKDFKHIFYISVGNSWKALNFQKSMKNVYHYAKCI